MTTWQREKMMEVMAGYKRTKNPVEIAISADELSWIYDYEDNEEYAQLAKKLRNIYKIILNEKLKILHKPKPFGVSCELQAKMRFMAW
jgi:hypothetical protein